MQFLTILPKMSPTSKSKSVLPNLFENNDMLHVNNFE